MSKSTASIVMGLAVLTLLAAPGAYARAKVGNPAPKFTLITYDKQRITLEDLKGQVIVLNYWATWCGPCKRELPLLDAYVRRHPELKVYAVATEDSVPPAKLKPLAAILSFPLIAHILGSGYGLVSNALPTNYVIDRAGIVRYAKAEAFDLETLNAVVGPILAEPAPAAMPVATPAP